MSDPGPRTERERRAQDVFLAALERPEAERDAFVAAACAGDAELRREVDELLRHDSDPDSRLEAPTLDHAFPALAMVPGEISGDRAYRLTEELGRGGMGVVYLAERADGEFRQRVAIKMLSGGSARGEALARRLRTERHILATLDHPGIAKLLDGGTLGDGSPFLVMELVEGVRIDRFCRERDLPVRDRIRLLLRVCEAVEAAHQRLIVHRDLKPGNILVTADGAPKLLDFGIAKLLEPDTAGWTVAETEHGVSPLTLRYASPEQVRGEPIGTASDVYSLGVVLFELLAGRSPYTGATTSPHRLSRAICDEEPPLPSVAATLPAEEAETAVDGEESATASTSRLRRRSDLAGDLDAIVLKALRKEPAHRYPSVAALAQDLQRHLDGLPVEARQGTRFYRAAKFVRRHRWPLAAAAAFVALLAGAAIVSFVQARALAAERDRVLVTEQRARDEAATAREVTRFLVSILEGADPEQTQGREPTLREVLDRGAERTTRELAGRPVVQAPLLEAIGAIYANLGQPDRGLKLLERSVELRRQRRDAEPMAYAEAVSHLAQALRKAGDYEGAEKRFREAYELRTAALGPAHPQTLDELNNLAITLTDLSRYEEAEPMLAQLLERRLVALRLTLPLAPEARLGPEAEPLVRAVHARGVVAYYLGRFREAASYFEQGLQLGRKVYGPRHTRVAASLTALASPLIDLGEHERALELLDEALAMRRAIQGEGHPDLAGVLINRSAALQALHRYEEVAAASAEAERILTASLGPDHPNVTAAKNNRAEALRKLGRPDEALRLHREILADARRLYGNDHAEVVPSEINVGLALLDLQRSAEAASALELAHANAARLLGAQHALTVEADIGVARALAASGRREEAVARLRRALPALERNAEVKVFLAQARFELARALGESPERRAEARAQAEQALAVLREVGGNERIAAPEIEAWLRARGGGS